MYIVHEYLSQTQSHVKYEGVNIKNIPHHRARGLTEQIKGAVSALHKGRG